MDEYLWGKGVWEILKNPSLGDSHRSHLQPFSPLAHKGDDYMCRHAGVGVWL